MKKIMIICTAICIGLAGFAGKGRCFDKKRPDKGGQVLVMGAQKDFKAAAEGKLLVFDTFVTLDESGNLLPKLAQSWKISRDGKVLVLHLRHGVRYHDGIPFNAKTAKFDVQRAMVNAVWAKYVDDIHIVDDYTLRIVFNTYYYPFLRDMASGWRADNFISPVAVMPPWDPKGKTLRFIGTGQFKLTNYKKDREAILTRNNDYWGKRPKLAEIHWEYTPDPYAEILALKAGELDIIGAAEHHSSVPFMKLAELEADSDIKVLTHSYGRYQVIDFNCRRSPFNDVRVRRAFNYAINRKIMVKSLFGNVTTPSYFITDPKFIWGPSNIASGYRYDPKKAKELLAQAGWRDINDDGLLSKNGRAFKVVLLVPTGEANADMVALVVQSQLKQLGVKMEIKTMINAWDKRKTGEYNMFLSHSGCLPSIPGGIGIGGKYDSAGTWPFAFHSQKLDALIKAAFTTTDKKQMRAECDEIWVLLHNANPCIPLYDIKKAVVMTNKVHGFKFGRTMFNMNLEDVVIDK